MHKRCFNKITAALFVFVLISFVCMQLNSAYANPKVLMETSKGNITIELYEKEAPITVKNFLMTIF